MAYNGEDIIDIEIAQKFFQAMDCKHFHMCREFPEQYQQYCGLLIPKTLELEWVVQSCAEITSRIYEQNTPSSDLWWLHSKLEGFTREIRTEKALLNILDATDYISSKITSKDKVIVAETIIGRQFLKYRSGLIFLAYDLKQKSIAKRFIEISLALCDEKGADIQRRLNAIETCKAIQRKLFWIDSLLGRN
jgi:hypothetical protein